MENQIKITHIALPLKSNFENFADRLENDILKHIEIEWSDTLKKDKDAFKAYVDELAGTTGLMIFSVQDHGLLLSTYNQLRKAKQFVIGNPMTAVKLTQLDIRAALYAPLRILVYEDKQGKSWVEYDLPSDLFGQFGEELREISKTLDKKLHDVILFADGIK